MDRQRLVIIGLGMAGTACLEEVLKADPKRFRITVFGAERHLNYNRVLLSNVLTGDKALEDISVHKKGWYDENNITLHAGCKVAGIRRAVRTVAAEGGIEAGYDKLILATGSVPFMPKIPGIGLEGVVTFRDMDDCEKLRSLAKKGARAVVIGGGLLGLEAAKGLLSLGLDVTVAHLMDRIMERQLDDTAARFLKEDLERLGMRILTGVEAVAISGEKKVEAVNFRDNYCVPADIVVVSAGIKPNTALARASGIYCQKGIVVSDTMQTYDPAIFAVGECVEHRGSTFGLVSPIFEQARVLADHLAGDGRLVFKNRPTSTRLKIPGIDLYSAGSIEENGSTETIEYLDRGARLYKKLIIEDDRLKGIIMYGETSGGARLFTRLLENETVAHRRDSLLFGDKKAAPSAEQMPDNAIVCGCNGVTRGAIVEAILKKGLFTREAVKRETRASGSCGGCAGAVEEILEATLGSDFQGAGGQSICACTKYSRDDVIKNIREKRLRSVQEVMETLGWEAVGCEVCRPALNYYVAMVWPGLAEDDTTSRLVNERTHANIQKDGTFSVVPRMYGGAATPEELKKIADVAVKYDVPLVKITGGQRIGLMGVKREDLKSVWSELGMESGYAYGKALRTVKTCVGESYCRYGTQDSLNLGIELERRLKGLWMPAKVKLGVSGCPRNCAETGIKDIGIVGVCGGFDVYAGGCGGIELKAAQRLCAVRTPDEVKQIASALIQLYREEAHYGERTYRWISRVGLNRLKEAVVTDIENRRRLCARLDEAAAAAADPWKEKTHGESGRAAAS